MFQFPWISSSFLPFDFNSWKSPVIALISNRFKYSIFPQFVLWHDLEQTFTAPFFLSSIVLCREGLVPVEANSKKKYQFLNIWILREYMQYGLEIADAPFEVDLERLVDDFGAISLLMQSYENNEVMRRKARQDCLCFIAAMVMERSETFEEVRFHSDEFSSCYFAAGFPRRWFPPVPTPSPAFGLSLMTVLCREGLVPVEANSKKKYQFLNIWILREYMQFGLEIADAPFEVDLERLVDDFGAISLLMQVYRREFVAWVAILPNWVRYVLLDRVEQLFRQLQFMKTQKRGRLQKSYENNEVMRRKARQDCLCFIAAVVMTNSPSKAPGILSGTQESHRVSKNRIENRNRTKNRINRNRKNRNRDKTAKLW
ncbi:hypothetical protein LXL04_029525 [Taraxacum kok-saghyz]